MREPKENLLRVRLWQILALWPTGITCGISTGAFTNAISGFVSPSYFSLIFWDWNAQNGRQLWRFSVEQGVLEGVVFGTVLGMILMLVVAFISKFRCPYRISVTLLFKVVAWSLLFWFVGGCNGILVAKFFPQFFSDTVIALPKTTELLQFAWVGGSIYGIYFGSFLSTIGVLISFAAKWRQLEKQAQI